MNDLIDPKMIRRKIHYFEDALSNLDGAFKGDNESCPLKHSFSPGIYMREIFIPKGTVVTGKIHKHEHPNVLLKGHVKVVTESGGVEELIAPIAMISPAGTKRVVYALEDTTWITFHRTDQTDLEKIEEEVIAKTYQELPEETKKQLDIKEEKLCLG